MALFKRKNTDSNLPLSWTVTEDGLKSVVCQENLGIEKAQRILSVSLSTVRILG